MTGAWPSLRPENGLPSDLALLALVLPGVFLAHLVLFTQNAPWAARLLVVSLDLLVGALIVLLALFLNRWLRYRLSERGVEVFGPGGWFPSRERQRNEAGRLFRGPLGRQGGPERALRDGVRRV